MFCPECGSEINDKAVVCVKCGVPIPGRLPSAAPVSVANYMTLAILSTLFCCQIVGLLAIVRAAEVNACLAKDDIEGARLASRKALRLILLNVLGCVAVALIGTAIALRMAR